MSNKIDLSSVAEALKLANVPSAQSREVIEALKAKAAADEADKPEKAPRQKTQLVVLNLAMVEGQPNESLGYVVKIPEDASPMTALERVHAAAHAFNASKKGRLLPVKSLGEVFESVSARFFKDADCKPLNKTIIPILRVTNKLPEAPSV